MNLETGLHRIAHFTLASSGLLFLFIAINSPQVVYIISFASFIIIFGKLSTATALLLVFPYPRAVYDFTMLYSWDINFIDYYIVGYHQNIQHSQPLIDEKLDAR